MRLLIAFLVAASAALLAVGAAAPAPASDHDRARRAVEEGRILPLRDILARAQAVAPGEVIEAELEDEGGVIVYEIKVLTGDNRVMKLSYNAATGELLKTRSRNGRQ